MGLPSRTLLSTRRTGLVSGPAGPSGNIGPPGNLQGGGFIGVVPPFDGGTGITSPGPLGNVLTSLGNGAWASEAPAVQLAFENAGVAITPRPIINLIGFEYADNPGAGRADFTVIDSHPAPGAVVSSNVTLTTEQTWVLFASGPYAITLPVTPQPGVEYLLTHVSGSLTGAGQVTLVAGGSYTIVDPQSTLTTPFSSVTLRTDGVTYRMMFDASNGVFRCVN